MAASSLSKIVSRIKNGEICKIVILSGAGVSCNSGIPDFRSLGGLYDTLQPNLLTASEQEQQYLSYEPTGVVDIRLFRQNQFPYLEVRRPFILGTAERTWKPTLAHVFSQLLSDKNLLRRVYTQNIDGLDHQLELDNKFIVNVHGSLGAVQCEVCKADYNKETFLAEVRAKIRNIYDPTDGPAVSENIYCNKCGRATVKPATVLFGTALPKAYYKCVKEDFPQNVDLLIVAGTSLTVSPACHLVNEVNATVPRVVINSDRVGEHLGLFLDNERDVFLGMDIDEGFLLLTEELGWTEDLFHYRYLMCDKSAAAIGKLHSRWQREKEEAG